MVEPGDDLKAVFDKALKDAKKLNHEYITLEHILFAMLCEEKFVNVINGYGADAILMKKDLENYLKTKCTDITLESTDKRFKPKKHKVLNVC